MPGVPLSTRLSPVDLAIVGLYLVAITLFGLRFSRRSKAAARGKASSLQDYFLAGNTIPWWAIALSIVSAETSTLTIISIPGVAYAGDLGFLQVVLGYLLGRVVVAMLFLPRYLQGRLLTAYQLINQRFSSDGRFGHALYKLTAGLFLLTRAAAEGVRVFAISIVVSIAIGTGDIVSIGLITLLTLAYTFEGGMAAVIWTDVVQMALYLLGTLAALWTIGHQTQGGWPHIHEVVAPLGKLTLFHFALNLTTAYTFWAGLLGGTFLTMASHGTDQLMVQRMLAARNLRESRLALLSSGVVIFVQFTLFLIIGLGLFVYYGVHPQRFASPDRIFPSFIVHQMPHGIAGLLIAAILAAAMSNLSAALNSLASSTVVDFYLPWHALRTKLSDAPNTTRASRLATIFWAAVLFAIAVYSIQHGGKGHVVETGLSIASVAYGCLLGVFLLGTLTRYANQIGSIFGMLCGLALNLYLWQFTHVAFTWYVLIGALVTFTLGSLFSLIFPRRSRTLAAVLLVAACISGKAQPTAQSPQLNAQSTASSSDAPDFTPISNLINAAIAEHKLPGAVVIVGHSGRVVFHHAYGNRALEPAVEPMTDSVFDQQDTIFDMASLTKVLVTTPAILQLYEQGKLDLDASVARYLPDFAVNNKGQITVRQLLTHYSGLPEDVDLKDAWGLAAPDKAEGLRRALQAVPYGPPGVTFKYSDINFIVLGALVEKLSGETLDAYAGDHFFKPLSMTRSGFHSFEKTCGPVTRIGSAIEPGPKPIGRIGMVCPQGTWSPYALDHETAPTAHDDQGAPATNPDFDHILRGTVHDPTTRRMGGVAGHAGVFSTADDTARYAQALLDKLLRNIGPFPLSQATLRLAVSPNEPATASHSATIFTQDGKTSTGVASRGLGWDLNSPFSRPRGELFPITTRTAEGSFGHTGFTGTSLWIDPTSDSYVILLANSIHPRVGANISPLRGQVATAAARILSSRRATTSSKPGGAEAPASRVATGIDVLEQDHFAALKALSAGQDSSLRLALLTNDSARDAQGQRTIDILAHAGAGIQLTKIFAPEHGLSTRQDTERLTAETDSATHIPVVSLYGPKPSDKHPKQSDLKDLDAVVIDLQDAGVRFWTYETLLGYMLEACAKAKVHVVILDRPNPLGGLAVEGPVSDVGDESYTSFMPLPLRHGLTFAELASYFNQYATEIQLKPDLLNAGAVHIGPDEPEVAPPATSPGLHALVTTIKMQHWTRPEFFADTGLIWTPPSPNLRSAQAAILYPAVGLIEQTNVSVGRGSPAPFESFGASWLKPAELAAYLTARRIPGVTFTPSTLTIADTPEHYPAHGQTIPAIHLTVTDRVALDSPELGVELLAALHHLYPAQFQLDRVHTLLASKATLDALRANQDPRAIAASWKPDLQQFMRRRQSAIMY